MREFTIVGGGVHGTYLLNRLSDEYDADELAVVDPGPRLLSTFRQRATVCGMSELRSPFVHHVGRDPFDLETFAEASDRTDELVPTEGYPPRPTLSLFLDHADRVIERRGLHACHVRSRVTGIRSGEEGFVLETTGRNLRSRRVVLAVGHGPPAMPEWACSGVEHVWADTPGASVSSRTGPVAVDGGTSAGPEIVVGGGSTAAQAALKHGVETLLTRHPLRTAVPEADPPWVNWPHIERTLHGQPPGSRARLDIVRAAKKSGTMRPALCEKLEASDVSIETGSVESAVPTGDGVALRLADGRVLEASSVGCATGFLPARRRPFVERLAGELGLERGYDGVAVLDDRTLEWRGSVDGIHVSGELAEATVGPFAGNIIGARRAADGILGGTVNADSNA